MEKNISCAMMIYRIDVSRLQNNQEVLNQQARANIAAKLSVSHRSAGLGGAAPSSSKKKAQSNTANYAVNEYQDDEVDELDEEQFEEIEGYEDEQQ